MSQQGLRQASVRAVSGTTLNYEGDWHAMWDLQSIPTGTFNERMLLYINEYLSASYTNLPGAMQAFATSLGATNFSSLGTFDASLTYTFVNAEAEAWVNAFTTPPSNADKGYYDTFVGALKSASLWTPIDVLWWLGGPDAQASRINAKNPGSLTLAQVGTVTHTAYRGFAGNGTDGYHTTGYNPSTFGGQWALNSAHMAVYSRTSALVAACEMGCRVSGSDNQAVLFLRSAGDLASFRLNQDGAGTSVASTDGSGLFVARRSASNATALFRNGSSLGTDNVVTDTIPNLGMFIGAMNQNGSATLFSTRELLFACAGASLTNQNITDLNTAVAAFATSIGA